MSRDHSRTPCARRAGAAGGAPRDGAPTAEAIRGGTTAATGRPAPGQQPRTATAAGQEAPARRTGRTAMMYGAAVLLGLGVFGATAAPAATGGGASSRRTVVNAAQYPWSAVGRINKGTNSFCTGTLIGPRLVLTAAHCLWDARHRRFLPPAYLHFVAGYQRGTYVADSQAESVHIASAFLADTHVGAARVVNDWAIVVLKKDVGSVAGYLGLSLLDRDRLAALRRDGATFVQAGYTRTRQYVQSAAFDCPVAGFIGGLDALGHGCDTVAGDAGAPILIKQDGAYRVVAMHATIATDANKAYAISLAVPSSRFMRRLAATSARNGRPAVAGRSGR